MFPPSFGSVDTGTHPSGQLDVFMVARVDVMDDNFFLPKAPSEEENVRSVCIPLFLNWLSL